MDGGLSGAPLLVGCCRWQHFCAWGYLGDGGGVEGGEGFITVRTAGEYGYDISVVWGVVMSFERKIECRWPRVFS